MRPPHSDDAAIFTLRVVYCGEGDHTRYRRRQLRLRLMPVGYSGTPLPKKLGFKPALRVALINVAPDVRAKLGDALRQCEHVQNGRGPLDLVMLATKSQADLQKQFPIWMAKLTPDGALWISWPKKSSGVPSDLDENKVRALGLSIGLVDIKVCAVSEVWSGLKFVIPVKDRPKRKQVVT